MIPWNELMIAALAILAGFSMGYVVKGYIVWSREYSAWQRRSEMHVVSEPPNGPWNNGRVA